MASLRKLRGKWYIRLWIDGKEKILPTNTTIKKDAEKQLRRIAKQELEIKQKIRTEIDDLNNRLTISQGIDYFIKNIGKERNLQDSTVYTYNLAMGDFSHCFHGYRFFDQLNKKDYSRLLNYLQEKYNSTTVNIRLRAIRAMLNYLLEKEMITKLPFKVKQIRIDQTLPKFITPEEMDKIYSVVDDKRMISVFKVFEVTGMRVGELQNSYRKGNFIIIRQTKSRKERIVPIPESFTCHYDIARSLNYTVSWISHSFSRACKMAGLKGKTIHCLRHTFALRKLVETNNIALVKELLGHSSVKVTEIYTRFPDQYLTRIFNERQINQIESRPGVMA